MPLEREQAVDIRITPVRRQNLAATIAHDLSQLILTGKYTQGDRLPSHNELASRFNVSVATMREAISALVRTGALEVRVGSGTFVRTNGADPEYAAFSFGLPTESAELAEFTEARGVIDQGLSRLAAQRRTAPDLLHLRQILEDLERAVADPEAFTEADLALHIAVAETARNRPLLRSMLAMLALLQRNIRANIERASLEPGILPATVEMKRRWVEAIAEGRPDDAARAIDELTHVAFERLAALMRETSPNT
jgi:GntR family transcriptional regulator, transcriptional repressor for pyruvate dehydrogenase complex